MSEKSRRWLIGTGIVGLGVATYFLTRRRRENDELLAETFSEGINKTNVPTLFFHGYLGNGLTFNGMVNRFVRNEIGEESITLTVSATGEVEEEGNWVAEGNPLIQVVFEDNTNQEWQQAEWIQQVLIYLEETYQISAVNLLGHSMGGVSIMRYLTIFGGAGTTVEIQRVVTIGSPFNDFNEDERDIGQITLTGPVITAPRYAEYADNFENVPRSTAFLTIAGDIDGDNGGDGTVPVASVAAINHLFYQAGVSNQFMKVEGRTSQHTALHENRQVDRLVIDFLWYHNSAN